jgi:hypothetical protein
MYIKCLLVSLLKSGYLKTELHYFFKYLKTFLNFIFYSMSNVLTVVKNKLKNT